MAWWVQLIVLAVSIAVSYLLRPRRPEEEDRRQRLPEGSEGEPVPIVYGRARVENPVMLYYNARSGPPDDATAYGMDLAIGVCLSAPRSTATATLHAIWIGEERWYDNASGLVHEDDPAVLNADSAAQRNYFGGQGNGGGFFGEMQWFGGSFTQSRSIVIERNFTPDEQPAFRGLAYLALLVNIGEEPILRPMAFEVQVQPDNLGYGGVGSDGDANPAEVLWDVLNSDWGRMGLATDLIDVASFQSSASTLDAEDHGIALVVQDGTARETIQEILRQIDAVLYEEPTTRELTLRLIRDDYIVADLPVYDEDDIVEITEYAVGQLNDLTNQVRVTFADRAAQSERHVVIRQNQAEIIRVGRIITSDFAFRGVSNQDLALRIADRELAFLGRPIIQMKVLCTRRAAQLRPGDVIRVSWDDYGITGLVMRVQSFDLGELDDGRVALNLAQDPFSTGFANTGD